MCVKNEIFLHDVWIGGHNMKKLCAVMSSCVLALTMATPVLATDEMNVWVDESELTVANSEVEMNVYSDGTNSDGQLVITYNADELSVSENDVVVGENVEMYSANVVEEGTLKIAYLAKTTDSDDILITITFDASTDELSEDAIVVDGNVYNEDGNELTLGVKEIDNSSDTDNSGDSTDTGDTSNITFYVSLAGLALLGLMVIIFCSRKTKTSK